MTSFKIIKAILTTAQLEGYQKGKGMAAGLMPHAHIQNNLTDEQYDGFLLGQAIEWICDMNGHEQRPSKRRRHGMLAAAFIRRFCDRLKDR